jgi:hypothetical protein
MPVISVMREENDGSRTAWAKMHNPIWKTLSKKAKWTWGMAQVADLFITSLRQ